MAPLQGVKRQQNPTAHIHGRKVGFRKAFTPEGGIPNLRYYAAIFNFQNETPMGLTFPLTPL